LATIGAQSLYSCGSEGFSRSDSHAEELAALVVAFGAALTVVAPAFPFSVVNPVTGECRQVLVPGPATFPGNWEVVSATPAAGPGPWNGHGHANENTALGPVICP
jgi:hypothetical protein